MKVNVFHHMVIMLVVVTLVNIDSLGQEDLSKQKEEGVQKVGRGKSRQIQKAAIEAWGAYLEPERDYNATKWITTTKSRNQPQYVFDYYVSLLSDLFKEKGAFVNFALVGACDGTNDNTIRDRYLPNAHWRALFVEPISLNFADLNKFLADNQVTARAHTIQAAVTNECTSPTIIVKTPIIDKETEDKNVPHWIRRQIGGIVLINPDVSRSAFEIVSEVVSVIVNEVEQLTSSFTDHFHRFNRLIADRHCCCSMRHKGSVPSLLFAGILCFVVFSLTDITQFHYYVACNYLILIIACESSTLVSPLDSKGLIECCVCRVCYSSTYHEYVWEDYKLTTSLIGVAVVRLICLHLCDISAHSAPFPPCRPASPACHTTGRRKR